MIYFLLLLTGLFGGFLAGFLGVGGGIIFIIVLPYAFQAFGMPTGEVVQFTIANSILGTLFSAISGTFNHWKQNEVYLRYIIIIGIAGTFSSLFFLYILVNTPIYQKQSFDIVVVALLLFMLSSTLYRAKREGFDGNLKPASYKLATIGLSSGLVASLSGLGGGIIIIPLLNGVLKLNIKVAKTISLGVIMITSLAMVIYNLRDSPRLSYDIYHYGYIVPQVILPIILGTTFASSVGVKVSRRLKASHISYIFAFFVTLVIIKKLIEIINA